MAQKVVIFMKASLPERFSFGTVLLHSQPDIPVVGDSQLNTWLDSVTCTRKSSVVLKHLKLSSLILFTFFQSAKNPRQCGDEHGAVCKEMFSRLPSSQKLWQLCSVYYKRSCHRQTSRCLLLNLQPRLRNLSRAAGTCPTFLKPTHGNMTPFIVIS